MHVVSATFEIDGRFFNVPTVIDGVEMDPREALRVLIARGADLGEGFDTREEAERSAKLVSEGKGRTGRTRFGAKPTK